MELTNLNSFLKYGYYLNYNNPDINLDLSGINKEKYKDKNEQELIDTGLKLWKETIDDLFNTNNEHVIPLSGGVDSRAILATLLDFTEADNIYTYTFGTPGSLDYEIGNYVARKAGTNHKAFPLNKYIFTVDKELDYARRIDCQTFLFHHPPLEEIDELFGGFNFWSGFILGWIAGAHLPLAPSKTRKEARKKIGKHDTFVHSIKLTNIEQNKLVDLFNSDYIDRNILSFEEQIERDNRLPKYAAPQVLYNGYNYIIPSMNKKLYTFFMSLDDIYRRHKILLKKMFLQEYPGLFSLPEKANFGLPLNAKKHKVLFKKIINRARRYINNIYPFFSQPDINYLDFSKSIREKSDLRNTIYSSIMDLKRRKVIDWIDIEDIWKKYINKKVDYSDALIILASLEIHLKVGKEI